MLGTPQYVLLRQEKKKKERRRRRRKKKEEERRRRRKKKKNERKKEKKERNKQTLVAACNKKRDTYTFSIARVQRKEAENKCEFFLFIFNFFTRHWVCMRFVVFQGRCCFLG